MISIIYLDDFGKAEEVVARSIDFCCVRLSSAAPWSLAPEVISLLSKHTIIVRGSRLAGRVYEELWIWLYSSGCTGLNSPECLRIASDFAAHYPIPRKFCPRSIILNANVFARHALLRVVAEKLRFPILVRGDTESAAKFIGKNGCTIDAPDQGETEVVLDNLRQHVHDYKSIVIKEIQPLPADIIWRTSSRVSNGWLSRALSSVRLLFRRLRIASSRNIWSSDHCGGCLSSLCRCWRRRSFIGGFGCSSRWIGVRP
jgi:hypothetical protein